MDQSQGETSLESPETITRRIEGHIVRSALDEERRSQKALILLKARDKKIALLEKKIAELEEKNGHQFFNTSGSSNFESSGPSTNYLSLPPSEKSQDEIVPKKNKIFENFPETKKKSENLSIPCLKLSTTSISNSEPEAVILKSVKPNFNETSSFVSDEFRPDESTVDFVVTAALAFAKFDDKLLESEPKVCGVGKKDKKPEISRSRKKIVPARMSMSLPWIKTRRRSAIKHLKRGMEKRMEKLKESDELSRNLREVQSGLDALLHKTTKVTQTDSSNPEKQKVEDKVVQPDAQEAHSTPSDPIPHFEQKCASTKTHMHLNYQLYDPSIIGNAGNHVESSQSHPSGHQESLINLNDEPAPQWLIEEALKRGQSLSENNQLLKSEEDENASNFRSETIICDLEEKLLATRRELADALNEQLRIKNKYRNALKNVKIAADEERDEMQEKLVKICTCILEKFGPNALTDNRVKQNRKKCHQKSLKYFGKLSRKLHRKLRVATLTSAKLKQEVLSTKKDLDFKAQQYDLLVERFENLKLELKNAERNINELRNDNISLRKGIDDTREWMQIRVSKERHEKINAAQFREIQRSRELSNLKKKSEEDLSIISQLRSKLLRLESANSNRGVLLSSYKSQLADMTDEKNKLSSKIKELEEENSFLRNNNAQLKATITLNNNANKKINKDLEKSEILEREKNDDFVEKMQSKLATKYERSMLQKIDTIKAKYDKFIQDLENKLATSENVKAQYFSAIKRFLKQIHEYYRELNAERDLNISEASEREAHETACTILNITPGELTGFLKGNSSKTINYWLSELQKIISKKNFAEDLGKLLFRKAIGSTEN